MINRRHILATTLLLATALAAQARAEDKPVEIRIGTQKGGFFPAVRQRQTLESAFKPLGIEIKWIDFQFGPPLLEAINVGSVDFGFVGDTPPIFAQAGGARIRYVAAVKSDGDNQAIIVPKDSPIKTLADLKGKRIAFGKGSSAHNLLVVALEKGGLSWSDITPAPLAPADATAAFVKGSVDAWSIWDPYLALAELKENARVLVFDKDVHKPNAYYIANTDFVEKYPSLVAKLNTAFASEGVWAESHHEEVAKAQAEATGVEAVRRFVNRSTYRVVPLDAEVTKSQQAVADRFAKLGLIPKPVNVSDIVWKVDAGFLSETRLNSGGAPWCVPPSLRRLSGRWRPWCGSPCAPRPNATQPFAGPRHACPASTMHCAMRSSAAPFSKPPRRPATPAAGASECACPGRPHRHIWRCGASPS
ncbi:sulfonate transport system substrate-binding protein [Bradyrhizobium sp. LM4.3]